MRGVASYNLLGITAKFLNVLCEIPINKRTNIEARSIVKVETKDRKIKDMDDDELVDVSVEVMIKDEKELYPLSLFIYTCGLTEEQRFLFEMMSRYAAEFHSIAQTKESKQMKKAADEKGVPFVTFCANPTKIDENDFEKMMNFKTQYPEKHKAVWNLTLNMLKLRDNELHTITKQVRMHFGELDPSDTKVTIHDLLK